MSTVIVYTAAKMQTVIDAQITSAAVVDDHLILTSQNGATLDAGDVRGPQGFTGPGGGLPGPQGIQGPIGPAGPVGPAGAVGTLDPATIALVCPVGTIQAYGGAVAPTGWIMCDGVTYLRTTYPNLFNAIGTAYNLATPVVNASSFSVPDLRQRVLLGKAASGTGAVLGSRGGSKDQTVTSHTHSHNHNVTVVAQVNHSHTAGGDPGLRWVITAPGSQGNYLPTAKIGSGVTFTNITPNGGHDHAGSTTDTDASVASTGVAGTDQNLPPYVVVNYIIRY